MSGCTCARRTSSPRCVVKTYAGPSARPPALARSLPRALALAPVHTQIHAHYRAQECCAIDYIVHTLDGTSALLNSNKWFPRTGVGVPETSTKYFQSISRRLYRILSHCYFHHTDIFAAVRVQCVCVCVCVCPLFVCVCPLSRSQSSTCLPVFVLLFLV